jgi:hypothetical protein
MQHEKGKQECDIMYCKIVTEDGSLRGEYTDEELEEIRRLYHGHVTVIELDDFCDSTGVSRWT